MMFEWYLMGINIVLLGLFSIMLVRLLLVVYKRENRRRKNVSLKPQLITALLTAMDESMQITPRHLPAWTVENHAAMIDLMLDLMRTVDDLQVRRIERICHIWNMAPHLIHQTAHGPIYQRVKALTLLGCLTDVDTEEALLAALKSPQLHAQLAALRALARRGSLDHFDVVFEALGTNSLVNPRLLADILVRFGSGVSDNLRARLRSKQVMSEHVLQAVIMALRTLKTSEVGPDLVHLLAHPRSVIRAEAVATLANFKQPESLSILENATLDDCAVVRARAACVLREWPSNAALKILVRLLRDTDWAVKFQAACALHAHGVQGQMHLHQAQSGSDPSLSKLCEQILLEMREYA